MAGSPETWPPIRTPEQIAEHIGQLGASLINESRKLRVALRAAQVAGAELPSLPLLEKFAPSGEADVQLLNLGSDLRTIVTEVVEAADLKITVEELHKRMIELDLEKE